MNILKKINFKNIICSLIIACFVILGFSFGDSILGFGIIGIVLFVLLLVFNFKKITLDDLIRFLILLIPFIAFGIITVVSRYSENELPIIDKVFIPISIVVYLFVGFFFTKDKNIKIKSVLLGFCVGIALISLLNFIITASKLGVFYSFKYSYAFLYYAGGSSNVPVSKIAYGLVGFKVAPISIQFYSLFPSCLLSISVILFFISPKENLVEFIIFATCLLIGLIALIFTVNKFVLVTDLFILLFLVVVALTIRFKLYSYKAFGIVLWVILGLCLLFVLLFIINAQSSMEGMHSFTSSNALFNVVFNTNAFANRLRYILDGAFSSSKLFGFPPYFVDDNNLILCVPSGNVFLDQFMYSGLFGVLFFLLIICLVICSVVKYLKNKNVDIVEKLFVFVFLGVVICYSSFNIESFRNPFSQLSYFYCTNSIWLFIVMISSYIFMSKGEEVAE